MSHDKELADVLQHGDQYVEQIGKDMDDADRVVHFLLSLARFEHRRQIPERGIGSITRAEEYEKIMRYGHRYAMELEQLDLELPDDAVRVRHLLVALRQKFHRR